MQRLERALVQVHRFLEEGIHQKLAVVGFHVPVDDQSQAAELMGFGQEHVRLREGPFHRLKRLRRRRFHVGREGVRLGHGVSLPPNRRAWTLRNPKNATKTTGRAACTQLPSSSADEGVVKLESISQRRAASAIGTPIPSELGQIKSTMAELIINELEEAVAYKLHARAASRGVSVEEELGAVLRQVRQSRSGVRLKQALLALTP